MKRILQAGLAALSVLAAPAVCAAEEISSVDLLAAQSKLGYNLLAGLAEAIPEFPASTPNLLVSPASLAGALSAMDLGADAAMHAALAKALGYAPGDADAALAALREVAVALVAAEPGSGPLSFANALFFAPTVSLSPVVSDRLKDAEVDAYQVALGTPEGIAQINDWVAHRTAGLIPSILAEPLPSAVLVALNALYFKDSWETAFDAADTVPGPFHVAGGSTEVPLMHLNEVPLLVREDETFVAVSLPFANARYSFSVVTTKGGPATLAELAPAADWLTGEGFTEELASLTLPKFEADASTSLLPIVEKLGLAEGYAGTAFPDFGVLEQITAIIQKAILKVDETGAEAAAATAVIIDRSLGKKDKPEVVEVVVDRPFLFSLRDDETGLVLLTGYVGNPAGPGAVVTPDAPAEPVKEEPPTEPAKEEPPIEPETPAADAPARAPDAPSGKTPATAP